jgi:hypothetical protein
MQGSEQPAKKNRKKLAIIIIILLIIIIPVITWIIYQMTTYDPVSVKELQSTADDHAKDWQSDAKLISIHGGEYAEDLEQDLHPGRGFEHICPKDENKNDGECYFWTFIYYSNSKSRFYKFSVKGDKSIIFDGNDPRALETGYYADKNIESYKDSTKVVKIAKENGGDEILKQYPETTVFYWLHKNNNGDTIWTIYYSYLGSIIHSVDINGVSGSFIGINNTLTPKSSHDFIDSANNEAKQWKADARLLGISGHEVAHVNPRPYSAPNIREKILVPPDIKPFDGMCTSWIYTYISNTTLDYLKVFIWSDGGSTSEIVSMDSDYYSKKFDIISNQIVLDSASATNIYNDFRNRKNYIAFVNYELEHTEDYKEKYNITCIWRLHWFSSPDSGNIINLNAINGTVLRY